MSKASSLVLSALILIAPLLPAQNAPAASADPGPTAPAMLPGNGPSQHPFLYAGE